MNIEFIVLFNCWLTEPVQSNIKQKKSMHAPYILQRKIFLILYKLIYTK